MEEDDDDVWGDDDDYGDDPTLPPAEIARLRAASREARRSAYEKERKAKADAIQAARKALEAREAEAGSSADCSKCHPMSYACYPDTNRYIPTYAWFVPSNAKLIKPIVVVLGNGRRTAATHLLPCDVHHNTNDHNAVCLGPTTGQPEKS
jgi:hypothetical protein